VNGVDRYFSATIIFFRLWLPLQQQVLKKVEGFLALEKDDPTREDFVADLRIDINAWVAKYRRRGNFTGRPSFGSANFSFSFSVAAFVAAELHSCERQLAVRLTLINTPGTALW
jgi:hypothetical protein